MSTSGIENLSLCFELETAGILLGWLTMAVYWIIYCALAALAIFAFIFGAIHNPQEDAWHELVVCKFQCPFFDKLYQHF